MAEPEGEVMLGSVELELAHKIAREWADVPASHLAAAFAAMEPQLQRTHEYRMRQADHEHKQRLLELKDADRQYELELARSRERLDRTEKAHRQHLVGVAAGAAVSLSCIGGAIWFGAAGHYWPMAILVGPVLIALTKMFVLRRSEPGDVGTIASAVNRLVGRAPVQADPGAGGTTGAV
ncbi:hypothetical protein [Kitasatospora terrestris]|uniref:hypothetical protein n=1 Tax=Kitasatospora terrestris TaxID=258051 RepID=UPI0031ED770B